MSSGEAPTSKEGSITITSGSAQSTTIPEAEPAGHIAGSESWGLGTTRFPVSSLAEPIRRFVLECAESLPVAPDLIALPALVTVGAAIGNARRIRLKDSWTEPAALYGAIVAETGGMKSPALQAATDPLRVIQTASRRTWTSDTTVERLGELLAAHPRGLLLIRDELSGWVRSLNQYKQGHGSDREFYLSAWSGVSAAVDRKGSPPILIPQPSLGVVGCIPPDMVTELGDRQGREDGFLQRILFAWPVPVPVRWTDSAVTRESREGFASLVATLLALDWHGTPVPLNLSASAHQRFSEWHDTHCAAMESPVLAPFLRGFYSKLKGYCARLGLIHALATDPAAEVVGEESIAAAIAQVEYFKAQAAKVADHLCRSVGVGIPLEKCEEEIKRRLGKGRRMTKREIQKGTNYSADIFNAALTALCKPQVIEEPNGTYHLRGIAPIQSTDIPTPTEVVATPVGTDIPTTNTTGRDDGKSHE